METEMLEILMEAYESRARSACAEAAGLGDWEDAGASDPRGGFGTAAGLLARLCERLAGTPAAETPCLAPALHPRPGDPSSRENARRLGAWLHGLEAEVQAMREVLERLHGGVLVLDREATVVASNPSGERILGQNDGICRRDGRLRLGSRREDAALRALLQAPSAEGRSPEPGALISLAVSRPSGRRPYALLLLELPCRGTGPPPLLALISDPELELRPSVPLLMRLHGFTLREAQIAARLATGRSIEEVAQTLGVSQNTARVHLRSLFRKTATRRQAELVRLLVTVPGCMVLDESCRLGDGPDPTPEAPEMGCGALSLAAGRAGA